MFDLVAPCKDCPFRNDKAHQKGWLGSARAQGIYDSLKSGDVFPCHKTTTNDQRDLSGDEDDDYVEDNRLQPGNQFCAGALILLEKTGDSRGSRACVTGEMLGLYKKDKLRIDTSPVFETEQEFVDWHGR